MPRSSPLLFICPFGVPRWLNKRVFILRLSFCPSGVHLWVLASPLLCAALFLLGSGVHCQITPDVVVQGKLYMWVPAPEAACAPRPEELASVHCSQGEPKGWCALRHTSQCGTPSLLLAGAPERPKPQVLPNHQTRQEKVKLPLVLCFKVPSQNPTRCGSVRPAFQPMCASVGHVCHCCFSGCCVQQGGKITNHTEVH